MGSGPSKRSQAPEGFEGSDEGHPPEGMEGTESMEGTDGMEGTGGMEGTEGMEGTDGMDGTGRRGGMEVMAPQSCPRKVNVTGGEEVQGDLMGVYTRKNILQGNRSIYESEDLMYIYYWEEFHAWRIGWSYEEADAGITSANGDAPMCPDMVRSGRWQAWKKEEEKFESYPSIVVMEDTREVPWGEFYANNFAVLIILLASLLVFLLLHLFQRRWARKSKSLEQHSEVMLDAHQFSVNLVKHFIPSMSVEKYQFRGMKKRRMQVDIAFSQLGLQLHSGVNVLHGVTGSFKAGRMCAILGPSGAGKTTFMNVLCGKATYGKMRGDVLINGSPGDISSIKSVTGFVPQDDIVHEQLTVREQIRFSAEMRNEVGTKTRRLDAITEDVLNVMQLLSVQGSLVGGVRKRGISGGQRKRVNVGLELAAQPTVLFLDEPTSGLDSTSSLAVVLSLKKMCQLGMTSIMVIHQPRYSLFTLFSDVLLLGKGGHTVYLGPSTGAKVYFESIGFQMPRDENPADWFMDVICGEVSNDREPNFKPKILGEWWEKRGGGGAGFARSGSAAWEETAERRADASDDRQVLEQNLDSEWESIDVNRDGVLEFDEMKLLMATCARQVPSDQVVQELMERMSETSDSVTQTEFVEYLMNLRSTVAMDVAASPTGEGHNIDAGSRSFGEISDSESDYSDSDSELQNGSTFGRVRELQRKTPGFARQMKPLFQRSLVLFTRKDDLRLGFLAALSLGAIVLGINDKYVCKVPRWEANAYLNTHTALSLLTSIFCLATYGNDQPVFLRDRVSGQNTVAYWLARQIVDLIDLALQSFTFASLYFVIFQPRIGFFWYMVPFDLVAWAASGWGYVISTIVPPEHGAFITALLIFVVCGLFGNPANLNQFFENKVMEVFVSMVSITRWSVGMSFLWANDEHPEKITEQVKLGTFQLEYSAYTAGWGGTDYYWDTGVLALVLIGFTLRMLSLLLLLFMPRNRAV